MLGESAPHTVLLFFFFFFFCGLTHVSDSLLSQWKGPAEHTQVWILWSTLCVQLFFSTFKSCFKTWSTPTLHHYPAPSSFSSSSFRLQHYLKVNLSGWAAVSLFCCSDLYVDLRSVSGRLTKARASCSSWMIIWIWDKWEEAETAILLQGGHCVLIMEVIQHWGH